MPFGRPCPKPRLNPRQKLPGQGNLGHQNQRLPPLPQTFRHRLQINFRLPRPRDPLQQRRRIAAKRHRGRQRIPRRHLIPRQPRRSRRVQHRKRQIARRVVFQHNPQLYQALDHPRPNRRSLRQFPQRHRRPAKPPQRLHHPMPCVRQTVRHAIAQPEHPPQRRPIPQPRCPRRQPQHRRQRRQRIIRRPRQERPHLAPHRRHIQDPPHHPQLQQIERPLPLAPHHPQHPPWPQRHLDKIAIATAAFRRQIVQHPPQRFRRQHPHPLARLIDPLRHPPPFRLACIWGKPAPTASQPNRNPP